MIQLTKDITIKIIGIILNLIVMILFIKIFSFLFFYLINKNKSIIMFYIGIIICIIIGNNIGKLFSAFNNNTEFKDYYDKIFDDPSITNYLSIIKNIFSKINILSKTVSKNDSNNNLILPNIIFIILIFCYLYLILCFSFSFSLNNNNKNKPNIIIFFETIVILYTFFYMLHCTLKLFKIKNANVLKLKHFNFVLNIGIYNLTVSTIPTIFRM